MLPAQPGASSSNNYSTILTLQRSQHKPCAYLSSLERMPSNVPRNRCQSPSDYLPALVPKLNPMVCSFVAAGAAGISVVLPKNSGSINGSVLLDEVICDLDLSTR